MTAVILISVSKRFRLGLVQGSMSICRYRLMGAGARISLATLNERLDYYLAGPISLDAAGKEEQIGWAT